MKQPLGGDSNDPPLLCLDGSGNVEEGGPTGYFVCIFFEHAALLVVLK